MFVVYDELAPHEVKSDHTGQVSVVYNAYVFHTREVAEAALDICKRERPDGFWLLKDTEDMRL